MDDPEKSLVRKPDDNEPLAGLAFKIMADQFQVLFKSQLHSGVFTLSPANGSQSAVVMNYL